MFLPNTDDENVATWCATSLQQRQSKTAIQVIFPAQLFFFFPLSENYIFGPDRENVWIQSGFRHIDIKTCGNNTE